MIFYDIVIGKEYEDSIISTPYYPPRPLYVDEWWVG